MDAGRSTPAEKHFGIQAGVETRISGGPANAARWKQYLEFNKRAQNIHIAYPKTNIIKG